MTKKNNNIKTIAITLEIPERDISNLLISAFEGGIGYWARVDGYETPEGPQVPRHARGILPLIEGGAIILVDAEKVGRDGEVAEGTPRWRLDRAAVTRGLVVMAEKYPRHFGDFISDRADAGTGDVFVQCAVLGDVVYG